MGSSLDFHNAYHAGDTATNLYLLSSSWAPWTVPGLNSSNSTLSIHYRCPPTFGFCAKWVILDVQENSVSNRMFERQPIQTCWCQKGGCTLARPHTAKCAKRTKDKANSVQKEFFRWFCVCVCVFVNVVCVFVNVVVHEEGVVNQWELDLRSALSLIDFNSHCKFGKRI